MPGSKRRALKQLLSPTSTPSSSANSAASDSTPGGGASSTSIASDSATFKPDASEAGDAIIEASNREIVAEMQRREGEIGGGQAVNPESGKQGAGGGAGMYAPLQQQVTAEQLMFGAGAGTGAGAGAGAGGPGGKGKKKSSKQRFAERQARKQEALLDTAPPDDPAWNAQLEKERQDEIRVISEACTTLGRAIYEIAPDGHCMFNAIADQLVALQLISPDQAADPKFTRRAAVDYMRAHPDDFMPFLPSITGEDSAGATEHDGMMTPAEFEKYCTLVAETGEWGGEPEIQALSRAFQIPIHVIQRGPPTVVSHGGHDDTAGGGLTAEVSASQGDRVVRISYHKRMYGLGEHYNSLRKAA